jgi:hypothetical protein
MIFGGEIPMRQQRSAAQRMGHKSAKKLLSLAFFHTLFYRF